MDEFDAIAYEAIPEPYGADDDWETVYATAYSPEESEPVKPQQKENYTHCCDEAEHFERAAWVSEIANEGYLAGEGLGVEVVGVVAEMLENNQQYGFEIRFWRVEEETPWDG